MSQRNYLNERETRQPSEYKKEPVSVFGRTGFGAKIRSGRSFSVSSVRLSRGHWFRLSQTR